MCWGVVMQCAALLQVNWQALWKPRWERSLREVLVFPLIILIMLVPLGLFTGGHTAPFSCPPGPLT